MIWHAIPSTRTSLRLLAVAACLLVSVAASGTAGAGSYSLDVDDEIDVPQRTVTVEGNEFTISKIARVARGNDVRVQVTAPAGERVDVTLRNPENQPEQGAAQVTDGETVTFSTETLSPGTYYAAVYADGRTRTVVPVVVAGYTVTADVPRRVARRETATVRASVTATAASGEPHRVQIVVGDDSEVVRVNATRSGDDYVAHVPTDELPPGEYAAFAVVRGEEEARDGRKELVGVSDRHALTVEGDTPTQSSTGADVGDTGGTGVDDGKNTTSAPESTVTQTETPNATEVATTADGATPTPTAATVAPTATSTSTGGDVITPASASATRTTTAGQPGFGAVAGTLAVAAVTVLSIRRRNH